MCDHGFVIERETAAYDAVACAKCGAWWLGNVVLSDCPYCGGKSFIIKETKLPTLLQVHAPAPPTEPGPSVRSAYRELPGEIMSPALPATPEVGLLLLERLDVDGCAEEVFASMAGQDVAGEAAVLAGFGCLVGLLEEGCVAGHD